MNRWEDDDLTPYRGGNAAGVVMIAVLMWAFGFLCGVVFVATW